MNKLLIPVTFMLIQFAYNEICHPIRTRYLFGAEFRIYFFLRVRVQTHAQKIYVCKTWCEIGPNKIKLQVKSKSIDHIYY